MDGSGSKSPNSSPDLPISPSPPQSGQKNLMGSHLLRGKFGGTLKIAIILIEYVSRLETVLAVLLASLSLSVSIYVSIPIYEI